MKKWPLLVFILIIDTIWAYEYFYPFASDQSSDSFLNFPQSIVNKNQYALYMGFNRYYISFEGLYTSFFGGVLPVNKQYALGFSSQVFNSPGYSFQKFSFQLAKQYYKFQGGLSFNFLNHSFKIEKFPRLYQDDPVLSGTTNKNAFSFGLGINYSPKTPLRISLNADHINQPNLSISRNKEKVDLLAGGSIECDLLQFTFQTAFYRYKDNNYFFYGLSYPLLKKQLIVFPNFSREKMNMGVRFFFNHFELNYQYQYSRGSINKVSSGSHLFLLTYFREKKTGKTELKETETKRIPFNPFVDINADKKSIPIKREIHLNEIMPILGIVFFDTGSHELEAEKYHLFPSDNSLRTNNQLMDEKKIANMKLIDQYHNVLNIVGRRLLNHPEVNMTIGGYNMDWGIEKNDKSLSRKRAQAVYDYLIHRIGIDSGQLTIINNNLPPHPSTSRIREGREENRRAEFTSESPIPFVPIRKSTKNYILEDSVIIFKPIFNLQTPPLAWDFQIFNSHYEQIYIQSGRDMPDDSIIVNSQSLLSDYDSLSDVNRFYYRFSLVNHNNKNLTSPTKEFIINFNDNTEIMDMEKIYLVLFNYDRSESDWNLVISHIQDIIEKIKRYPQSKTEVLGYTDVIGSDKYNLILSQKRAESVALNLEKLGLPKHRMEIEGKGSKEYLLHNDTPEGRILNRRVEIIWKNIRPKSAEREK